MGLCRTKFLVCLRVIFCLLIVWEIHGAGAIPMLRANTLLRDEEIVEPPDCAIEGDEGLYGIGVRAGIYLQVFASMFTLSFQPDQGPAFLYAAAALQAALFVALVYASAKHEIHASEGLIAILLLIVMILFEVLVFASIFIHVVSGQFRLANADRIKNSTDTSALGSKLLASSSGSNSSSTSIKRNLREDSQRQATSEEQTEECGEITSLRSGTSSGQSLTRQKTRIAQVANPAKLNINEALYNSDPLLIDDENLKMLAKVVNSYTGGHAWASAVLIGLLILGCYGYMLWFWWVGMNQMKESPCGSHGFFVVATFDIQHWVRWVVRVVLILAGVALLAMLYQCISALAGFCVCLVFQFDGSAKTRSSTFVQRMKEFFDRVSELNLPPATEYLLLVLVFKSFIVHSPERIFIGWVRKLKNKEADEKQESQRPSTAQISSHKSHDSKAKDTTNHQDEDKDAFVVNGTTIQCSKFFKIRSRPLFYITVPNKFVSWLLKPEPSLFLSVKESEKNSKNFHRFIIPYADNFETITVNLMILLGHLTYFIIVGVLLAAGIWSVELTISKNHITSVNHLPSAAQLIPFIIGLGSFCQSGLSALGAFWAWLWGVVKLRRRSESWFEALVGRFFYEVGEDEGGVNVEYLKHFPLMLVIWMLFPTMRKGQSIYDFRKEFSEEMNERGGFFALDLLD